jgi:competence protein ComEC
LAAPLMLLLQPLLFLALLLAPLRALSSFVADASLPLLSMFEGIARIGAEPKWSAIDVAPTLLSALLAGVAAAAVTAAAASAGRRPLRYLVVGGIAVAAIVWWPLLSAGAASGRLEIHLIDVGQGDAIGLRLPDRRWILFDAGRSWQGGDAGRRQIVPYLRRRGGDLFAFVLSHPHSDHVGGAASVIRWLKPRFFWDAAYVAANEDYLDALRSAAAWGSEWRRVRPGEAIGLGRVALEFLAPDSAWAASLGDPNEASTVALVSFGDIRILLTGDAEREEEEWLVSRYGSRLRATVLKVYPSGAPMFS